MTVPLQDESFMTHAVNAWADTVYRVALTRMRSPCDAEDVVQDVFVSLMRSARKFEDDKHLKAWLITATINRCRSLARAHGRRGSPSTTNSPSASCATEQDPMPLTCTHASTRFGARSTNFPTTCEAPSTFTTWKGMRRRISRSS